MPTITLYISCEEFAKLGELAKRENISYARVARSLLTTALGGNYVPVKNKAQRDKEELWAIIAGGK